MKQRSLAFFDKAGILLDVVEDVLEFSFVDAGFPSQSDGQLDQRRREDVVSVAEMKHGGALITGR